MRNLKKPFLFAVCASGFVLADAGHLHSNTRTEITEENARAEIAEENAKATVAVVRNIALGLRRHEDYMITGSSAILLPIAKKHDRLAKDVVDIFDIFYQRTDSMSARLVLAHSAVEVCKPQIDPVVSTRCFEILSRMESKWNAAHGANVITGKIIELFRDVKPRAERSIAP